MSTNLDLVGYSSGDILTNSFALLTPQEIISTTRVSKGWKQIVDDGLTAREGNPLLIHALWKEVNGQPYREINALNVQRKNLINKIKKLESDSSKRIKLTAMVIGVLALGAIWGTNDGSGLILLLSTLVLSSILIGDSKLRNEINKEKNNLHQLKQDIESKKNELVSMDVIKFSLTERGAGLINNINRLCVIL